MNLDTSMWKKFLLTDYFNVEAGHYYYSKEYGEGTTPYISASNTDNGITAYIDLKPDFDGNCITTGKVGCTAFYQPFPFCATSDVNVICPKFDMHPFVGLFIVQVINFNENYRWNYGRQCRVGDTKDIVLKLPATSDGKPDWEWMEDYIKSLRSKPITTKNSNIININTKEWDWFKLGSLIDDIYKAVAHSKADLYGLSDSPKKGYVPFVTRTELNNGVDCYVDAEEVKVEEGNALVIGDTTSTISYQPKPFSTGDHIVVIRASWLNESRGLFLTTLLQHEQFRYSYGRAFVMDSIKNTSIKLPVSTAGKPDWEWMENYIKSLPYGDRIG